MATKTKSKKAAPKTGVKNLSINKALADKVKAGYIAGPPTA